MNIENIPRTHHPETGEPVQGGCLSPSRVYIDNNTKQDVPAYSFRVNPILFNKTVKLEGRVKAGTDGVEAKGAVDLEREVVPSDRDGPTTVPAGKRWTVELGSESGGAYVYIPERKFLARVAPGRVFKIGTAYGILPAIPGLVAHCIHVIKDCCCCC